MKTTLLFLAITIGIVFLSSAKEVKPEAAKRVAQNFTTRIDTEKGQKEYTLVHTRVHALQNHSETRQQTEVPLFYVFNAIDDAGFVIVSADDNAIPVLGYSTTSTFDSSNLPNNFSKWLEGYKNQIRFIITHEIKATEEIKKMWEQLENARPLNQAAKDHQEVPPLLSTKWSQAPFVNDLCPWDDSRSARAVTGCPATAMAQIMKYWQYPANGTGFHSYNHSIYGTLSANFGATTYDWNAMPDFVEGPDNAVATLMYHCGVAVEMNYGVDASGSYVIIDYSPTPQQTCENAFQQFFGYDTQTIQGVLRANYSDQNWKNLLINELDNNRPIQYAGFGAGGHTWVCDGYDNNEYFHMNWGWGGHADGYFLLDALNPGSGGTGSGAGTYNDTQQMLIGIQPPSGGSPSNGITLYDAVTVSPNPAFYSNGFEVRTDLANFGASTFTGDFCAAIFDQNLTFVDFVEVLSDNSLGSNMHFTNGVTFTYPGALTLLPGDYAIGIFYKPAGGDWVMVQDGEYENLIPLEVYYSNDIELYQDFLISCGNSIERNLAFSVTLDILNDGNSTFVGNVGIGIYDLDGYLAAHVQTLTGANLDPGYYYDDLLFECDGVDLSPGTYFLAVMHQREGGDWELTGSSYCSNPIFVNITEESLAADAFEPNDTQNEASQLMVSFDGSNAAIATENSNLHISSDEDYYKIDLPSGFTYFISARVHDSYNSGNGITYTCDVSWLYHDGAGWSSSYDDVMSDKIHVPDGGTVYFRVVPFFASHTGTYLLDLNIFKELNTSTPDLSTQATISVYPNPATETISVEAREGLNIQQIRIVDILGRQFLTNEYPGAHNTLLTLSVEELPPGMYILLIQTHHGTFEQSFIKSE